MESARTEQVLQGPQEGFNENLEDNISLVRKNVRSADLVSEYMRVGTRNRTFVAVMYMDDLVNSSLVKEVIALLTGLVTLVLFDLIYKFILLTEGNFFPTTVEKLTGRFIGSIIIMLVLVPLLMDLGVNSATFF